MEQANDPPVSPKPTFRLWMGLVLLGAFALRLFRLGVPSLWYDETYSVYLARLDLASLTHHTAGDIHPPLYYYLLHFWGQWAGWSEYSTAFLSLFFGILLIVLVYRAGRDWFAPLQSRGREPAALLGALLVAISPYQLWYSQEVRMYTLGAVLGLASVYLFLRLFAERPKTKPWLSPTLMAYAIVSALGLYTLYYFLFLLVFENLLALLYVFRWLRRKSVDKSAIINPKSEIARWLASQFAIVLLYLPWLTVAFRQATNPPVPPWRTFTDLSGALVESFTALALGQSVSPVDVWPVLVIVAAVLGLALGRERWGPGRFAPRAGLLFGYTFIPLVLICLVSLWVPLYHVRYILFYSPGFYLLLGLGLVCVSRLVLRSSAHLGRVLAIAVLLLLGGASVYSDYNYWYNPRYADDDLRSTVRYIASEWRPGDAVLIDAGYTYTAFLYYYDQPIAWRGRLTDYIPRPAMEGTTQGVVVLQTGSIGGAASLGWGSPESDFYATSAEETRTALDRVFAAHSRVWLLRLYDTVVDPDGVIRDYLAQHGRTIDVQSFQGQSFPLVQGVLTPRATLVQLPTTAAPRRVLLGNRVRLLAVDPDRATIRAGTSLDVNLYWQAVEPTNIDDHLFIGLLAADGTLVAQKDGIPLGNAWGTSRWLPGEILCEPVRLMIPGNLAAGLYTLRATLYNPLTNEPLSADKSEWVSDEDQIKLTDVRIQP